MPLLVLVLLFTLVPFVELALLLKVGQRLGPGPTLALVVATGVVGAALARRQGLRVLRAIQEDTAAGRLPGRTMVEGALVLLAGALLVTPGVLTDAVGFALLVPPLRALAARGIAARLAGRAAAGSQATGAASAPDVLDAEVLVSREVTDPEPPQIARPTPVSRQGGDPDRA